MTYDRRYLEFLYYFNETRDYFECHEVMEALWLDEGRNLLYQGLLQVAVGLYHHENGNPNGAVKLLGQAVDKLRLYPEDAMGIRLGELLEQSRSYLGKLQSGGPEISFPFSPFTITIEDPELRAAVERLKEHPPFPGEEE